MFVRELCELPFPPHTRGCTRARRLEAVSALVSPAHAGMYLRHCPAADTGIRFPRTRGDVPHLRDEQTDEPQFPPHTRGCIVPANDKFRRDQVSPAHAGMYRSSGGSALVEPGFPRTRGDVP